MRCRARRACRAACATSPSARRRRRTACTTRPIPSSQIACTIGGNVAENSGGVHCLKYGLTAAQRAAVRGFTVEGEPVEFGSDALDARPTTCWPCGGQRGHAGRHHRGHRRWCPNRSWRAASWPASTTCARPATPVAAVIAAGIIPAGLEMMDKPMTAAVEDFVHAGYDLTPRPSCCARATARRRRSRKRSSACARCSALRRHRHRGEPGRGAAPAFWSGRKNAFPPSGRISPDYMCMDSTIPRKRLADILLAIQEMEKKYQLRCANVFPPATATCTR